ncbi:YceI family protein [Brevundimonas sp. TWP2-3-4b1]|uniref:YceI family protein n=1 Tax=Brevundimonas sp. TWP2-3-4b1 TaxID=2804580 RepID=UPI003CF61738
MLNRRLLARTAVAGALVLSLIGGVVTAQTAATRVPAEVQAGTYKLDPGHGKITWKVNHLGFSTYVGQFVNVSADLTLDPANPSASTLTATVPLADVAPNDDGLKAHLQTPDFFNTAEFPTATFVARSIMVDRENATEADVVGDLTLHGVTRSVTMEVEFNQAGPSMGNIYRVGFDGEATIRRSDFGMSYGLPAIGDEVELHFEGEFVKQ